MQVTSFTINLTSDDPERMLAFYRDVLELPQLPEDQGAGFQAGEAIIFIDGHSETRGPTKEPSRVLINMHVDDLAAEQARLEALHVPFVRKAGREFWGGVFSTFTDPDGNYLQLVEYQEQ